MTNPAEVRALTSVIAGHHDTARQIIAGMSASERVVFTAQIRTLADLLDERVQLIKAAHGRCQIGTCGHPSSGYYTYRGIPQGVCHCHRKGITDLGWLVYEPPMEVEL